MLAPVDASSPWSEHTVSSCADLVELLRAQHQELEVAIARLPHLAGAARADEFLLVRRRLAVHQALESQLVAPRLAVGRLPDPEDVRDEVLDAEQQATGTEFETSAARLLAAHLRHAEVQERSTFEMLSGALTAADRAKAGAGVRLWQGEGEAYLGHSYHRMVETAHEQLAEAPEPGHAPPLRI